MHGGIVLAATALLVVGAWLLDRRRRGYADRPTTPAAAVFAGRNEVKGQAATPSPLASHRTKAPCVWWDYRLEEERTHTRTVTSTDSNGRTQTRTERYQQWHEIDEQRGSLTSFEVVDRTGSVTVRLDGADIVPRSSHHDVFRRDDDDRGFLGTLFDNRTGRYRETERIVGVGDTLFVCGDAVLDERTFVPTLVGDVLVSTRSEESHTSRLGAAVGFLVALASAGLAAGTAMVLDPDDPGRPAAWLPGLAAGVLLLLVVWVLTTYNRLHLVAEGADRAWSLIDVQLQRRHDLVPALVAAVAAHAAHERGALEAVGRGRWVAGASTSTAGDLAAEARAQTGALHQVLGVAERYPELGADEAFRSLQDELADSENRLAASRTFYNEAVTLLRDRARSFPGMLLARPLRVDRRDLLEAAAFERTVPGIELRT